MSVGHPWPLEKINAFPMGPWLILRKCIVIKTLCLLRSLSPCQCHFFLPLAWIHVMLLVLFDTANEDFPRRWTNSHSWIFKNSNLSLQPLISFVYKYKIWEFEGMELCISMNCVYKCTHLFIHMWSPEADVWMSLLDCLSTLFFFISSS